MRKQSFLSLTVILMLFFSACTKEDLQNNNPSTPVENNSLDAQVISYSNWTADASFSWSDGATTEPSRQFDLAAPELTQELLDAGSFVLVYAQSTIDGSIQAMPVSYSDVTNNESNFYSATYAVGSISVSHTRSVNGVFEVPNDSNEISFRYIVVKPNTPDPNGRQITIYDLVYMPYKDVVNLLGIPE